MSLSGIWSGVSDVSGGIERKWQQLYARRGPRRVVLLAGFVLAVALRLQRYPLRFSQISFAYAAYYQPWVDAVERSPFSGWLTFVGLHPPLYSAIVSLNLVSGGGLLGAHLISAAFSACGVVGLYQSCRLLHPSAAFGFGTALLASVSVYGLHYALEINNYPLLWALSSWMLCASLKMALHPSPSSAGILVALVVLGIYTHILAIPLSFFLLAAILTILLLRYRLSKRLIQSSEFKWWSQAAGLILLAGLPLLRPILEKAGQGSTFQNESPELLVLIPQILGIAAHRFGSEAMMFCFSALLVIGCRTLWQSPRTRAGLVITLPFGLTVGLILALQHLGIAAAHQLPYFMVVLPGLLFWAGAATLPARRSSLEGYTAGMLLSLIVAQIIYGQLEVYDAKVLESKWNLSQASASFRAVLDRAEVVWLIAPPRYEDDDKRAADPVYSSLGTGVGCRFWQDPALKFEYVDYRFGQPMRCGTKIYFAFTDIYQNPMDQLLRYFIEKGIHVYILLYGIEESPGMRFQMEKLLEGKAVSRLMEEPSVLLEVIAP